MSKLIVVSGKMNSGKDTFVNCFVKHFNYYFGDNIYKFAFADPIKEIAKKMYGVPDEWLCGPSKERNNYIDGTFNEETNKQLTVRELLTSIGKFGRKYNKNCWAISTLEQVDGVIYVGCSAIISDCRFINEAELCKKRDCRLIRIIRDNNNNKSDDESETDLDNYDKFDEIIYNNNISELDRKALNIVNKVFGTGKRVKSS